MSIAQQHLSPAQPWWRRLLGGRQLEREAAFRLYGEIVKQARRPVFFTGLGIPDSPEGRFETVALHAALVMRRLKAEGAAGRTLAQALFDVMFMDVDVNLREIGVGDLSVGKYVKRFARQFYARIAALESALATGERTALEGFLAGNVWRGGAAPPAGAPEALARYLFELDECLGVVAPGPLLAGRLDLATVAAAPAKAIDRPGPSD